MAHNLPLQPARLAMETHHPLREALDNYEVPSNFHKRPLNLAWGDPSSFPEFKPHPTALQIITDSLYSGNGNGYVSAAGPVLARKFLANRYSNSLFKLSEEDVFLDSGGSGALSTIFSAILNEGDNILVPSPGYPLYAAIAQQIGAEPRFYNLKRESNWEVDIEQCRDLIDENTKFIVFINPSNPCGSVWSREHQKKLVEFAKEKDLMILADEVYEEMTLGAPFYRFSEISDEVTIISIGSLSKLFVVPGWRLGWFVLYDKQNKLDLIRQAIMKIKNILLHPVSFISNALPQLFTEVPITWRQEILEKVKSSAIRVYTEIESIPGLSMDMPQGSLFCTVQLDLSRFEDISTSIDFTTKFSAEEGVFVLPIEYFYSTAGFRIVLCYPQDILSECFSRMRDFVYRHMKPV